MENEDAILNGKMKGELVGHTDPRLTDAYNACSDKAWEKIYRAPEVVDIEIAGNRIITYLMGALMDAVMNPGKNFSRLLRCV